MRYQMKQAVFAWGDDFTIKDDAGADVFFVDIGLPPGKGAGSIVERYGEELVALRDAATCPH